MQKSLPIGGEGGGVQRRGGEKKEEGQPHVWGGGLERWVKKKRGRGGGRKGEERNEEGKGRAMRCHGSKAGAETLRR